MRTRWFAVGFIALAGGIVISLASFYVWSIQPATSRPKNQAPAVKAATTERDPDTEFRTRYFSAMIPAAYATRSHDQWLSGGVIDRYLLVSPYASGGDQLAITIGTLPSDGISGVSDVVLRLHNPQVYQAVEIKGAPSGAVGFVTKGDAYEEGIFMPNGSKYAAIVLSGTISRESTLDQQMTDLLSSWQWL